MVNYYTPPRMLGRVQHLADEGRVVYVAHGTGSFTVLESDEGYDVEIGTVVLIDAEQGEIEAVPSALWNEETWIGVVRHGAEGKAVVERDSSLVQVASDLAAPVRDGNTVEVHPTDGVVRVISESPLQTRLLDATGDSGIASYRTSPSKDSPTFADFGGLAKVKQRARELIELPLLHHELLARIGARPIKGVLFTGGPGTGKTMLARIIAAEADAEFYEISGPQIFNKWYGQSERVIRDIFSDARSQDRAIVFFDEIDSVAGRRAEDSHEASRRVVAQLLTEMDGFKSDVNVVVIATTNRPQDIDPALRRPGRFDWEIDFPMPELADRLDILEIGARRLAVTQDLDHSGIAAATEGWSAAELSAIYSEAALMAVDEQRDRINSEDYWAGFERVNLQRSRAQVKP